MNNNIKLETLKRFLISTNEATPKELAALTVGNAYNENYNTFEVIGNEYKVLTDDEADEEAKENILNSLWAFNAYFTLEHTDFYKTAYDCECEEFAEALQMIQDKLGESANSIVKALIYDLDEFVEDAIDIDGRGNFISYYDGVEHWDSENDLYIYIVLNKGGKKKCTERKTTSKNF